MVTIFVCFPAVFTDNFIILSFEDHNQLCFIHFAKKVDSADVSKRLEKLSCLDLKVELSVGTVSTASTSPREPLVLTDARQQ